MNDVDEELAELVRIGAKIGTIYHLMRPMLTKSDIAWQENRAFLSLLLVLSQRAGTIDGERQGQLEAKEDLGSLTCMASDRTIQRAIKDYGRVKARAKSKKGVDYDPALLAFDMDVAHQKAFRLALALLNNPEYHANLDGTSKPFTGKSWKYLKKGKKIATARMSRVAYDATGAFRGKKNGTRGSPMYRGTVHKLDETIGTVHLYETQATLMLTSRPGLVKADQIDAFLDTLRQQPYAPVFFEADKEFCNSQKSPAIRKACDDWKTVLLMACSQDSNVEKMVLSAWHDGLAKRIQGPRDDIYFASQEHAWSKDQKTTNTMVTYFFAKDPRKDKSIDDPSLGKLPNGMWAACFITNVKVTPENAYWILKQYSKRWGIENFSKRADRYTGTSQSQGQFMRHFITQAGYVMLNAYALWRIGRQQEEGLKLHDKRLSHSRFFGAVHIAATKFLLRLDQLEARRQK